MSQPTKERVEPSNVGVEDIERYRFAGRFVADKRVLDFACGTGYGSYLLWIEGRASAVYGADASTEAMASAQQFVVSGAVQFVVGEAGDLPFDDAFFDVVVSLETLEHLADAQIYLQELRRVLAPDGAAIISTPRNEEPSRFRPSNPFHIREYAGEEFCDLLGTVFDEVEIWSQITTYRDDIEDRHSVIARSAPALKSVVRRGLPAPIRRGLRRAIKSEGLVAQDSTIVLGERPGAAYQIAVCRGGALADAGRSTRPCSP